MQLISALERLGVDLLKGDPVEPAFKDVYFFNIVVWASNIVALPGKGQLCVLGAL